MTFFRILFFALRNLSRMGYYQAGAEMCGGSERRAKADAYRALHNMTAPLVRASLVAALTHVSGLTVRS